MPATQGTEDGIILQLPLLLALPDPNSYTSIYTLEERKKDFEMQLFYCTHFVCVCVCVFSFFLFFFIFTLFYFTILNWFCHTLT